MNAFAAFADPFDRPADFRGREGDHRFFGVVELFDAETAADVRRHDAQLVLRNVENERAHQQAYDVRELARRPKRVMFGRRVVFRDRRARLHRIADETIVDQADAGNVRRPAERRIGRGLVSDRPVAAKIVRYVVEQQRRIALDGIEHADHSRQHFVFDGDRLGGDLSLFARLRHHERDRIADVPDFALSQCRVRRLLHRQAVLSGNAPAAWQSADAGRLEVIAGHYRQYARHGQRGRDIERLDGGVRVR